MDNKLDILTKKLYDEGIEKAQQKADEIIAQAEAEANKIVADAESKAERINSDAKQEAENLKKKAESEITLTARQSIAALKQSITDLISGKVSQEIAQTGFEDKAYIQELLMSIVKKWDVQSGNLDMEILLSPEEKNTFESFVQAKYKNLLDKGLTVKVGDIKDEFIIQPKDGSFQIGFSEQLFEAFFNRYIKELTKNLLYKDSK